jgi:hypothetical protein
MNPNMNVVPPGIIQQPSPQQNMPQMVGQQMIPPQQNVKLYF